MWHEWLIGVLGLSLFVIILVPMNASVEQFLILAVGMIFVLLSIWLLGSKIESQRK